MRIKQVHISRELEIKFGDNFRSKWTLEKYNDINAPAVFFGLYTPADIETYKKHNSLSIVLWGGVDKLNINTVNMVIDNYTKGKSYQWLSPMIIEGREYAMPVKDYSQFKAVPCGSSIYIYKGWLGNRHDYFKWNEVAIPLINHFGADRVIYGDNMTMQEVIDNLYNKCFVYVKPIRNGGCTAMWELAHMGRVTIGKGWNLPFFKEYLDINTLISLVRQQEQYIGKVNNDIAESAKGCFVNDIWLYTEFWESNNYEYGKL